MRNFWTRLATQRQDVTPPTLTRSAESDDSHRVAPVVTRGLKNVTILRLPCLLLGLHIVYSLESYAITWC
jgi:hypothetical protein